MAIIRIISSLNFTLVSETSDRPTPLKFQHIFIAVAVATIFGMGVVITKPPSGSFPTHVSAGYALCIQRCNSGLVLQAALGRYEEYLLGVADRFNTDVRIDVQWS
ncbi:MAG: hypothetical protein CM1200mP18_08330 [Gammaproteobacteria bacterium]|nr:MAG: hypothetical protein CM1200mP18_08330 [Gammaproteobacteria bacterium]